MISDTDLLQWNHQGLIPAPDESEESFQKRAFYCLGLQDQLSQTPELVEYGLLLPQAQVILQKGCELSESLFDIKPEWVPLFFSNDQLAPWHGGCATIFQINENSPTSAFLQLRSSFQHQNVFLGLYNREELIAHELAHVGRMVFQEPKYEEILACQANSSRWRRWFGPIVQSSWESVVFVLILFLLIMLDIYLIVAGNSALYALVSWLKLVPVGMILLALGRLGLRQCSYKKALKNVAQAVGDNDKMAKAILYRLSDQEIGRFAKMAPQEILAYAEGQRTISLRWRLISLAYL